MLQRMLRRPLKMRIEKVGETRDYLSVIVSFGESKLLNLIFIIEDKTTDRQDGNPHRNIERKHLFELDCLTPLTGRVKFTKPTQGRLLR